MEAETNEAPGVEPEACVPGCIAPVGSEPTTRGLCWGLRVASWRKSWYHQQTGSEGRQPERDEAP